MVRAKFYVQKITRAEGSSTADQVVLGAVCRGVENALWSQYTPSGTISMGVLNEAATAQFIEGEEYEVTFTRVTRPKPGDGHAVVAVKTMHGNWVCETCGANPSWDFSAYRYPELPPAEALDWSTHREVYG